MFGKVTFALAIDGNSFICAFIYQFLPLSLFLSQVRAVHVITPQ